LGFRQSDFRLPSWAKKIIREHPNITDLVTAGTVYEVLGGPLTALIGLGVLGSFLVVRLYRDCHSGFRPALRRTEGKLRTSRVSVPEEAFLFESLFPRLVLRRI